MRDPKYRYRFSPHPGFSPSPRMAGNIASDDVANEVIRFTSNRHFTTLVVFPLPRPPAQSPDVEPAGRRTGLRGAYCATWRTSAEGVRRTGTHRYIT